jgi:SpoVK/Ycf46/Vps4 family AAA+-type ATPase
VVALNASYHLGPASDCQCVAHLVIARRDCAAQVVRLMEDLDRQDRRPHLHTLRGRTRSIAHCDWDQLVLDPEVISLLKEDFESFFERSQWFHDMQLPFRRGYLLHGPPGNGKSTAIRAMMSSRGLPAYTLRLFDPNADDRDLDSLFDSALRNRPAMVLLEDIDRAFPKAGESKSRVSLQQLLNCLDGVGTGEGIIVVATANEPTILDPAILRRPGRFDRVVHFPNPDLGLRQAYLQRMNPTFETVSLRQAASESDGFSFAQLREAFIMAGQHAYGRKDNIKVGDLLAGIRSSRQALLVSSNRSIPTGFRTTSNPEVTA